MSRTNEKKIKRKDRLDEVFRVSIVHEENLQEVKNFTYTKSKLYLWITASCLLICALVISLIFFTPLRRTVPGYADIKNNAVFVDLNKKLLDLETEVINQSTYIEGLLTVVSGPSVEEKLNKVTSSDKDDLGYISVALLDQKSFISPVKGTIEKKIGVDEQHFGVDIIAPKNAPIKSVLDGVVINSDWTLETGNTISIQHADNIISIYKHNSVLLKEIGNHVKAGEAIAIIGNTGELTSGPHLHFELWHNGKAIDPEEYIAF